MEQIELSHYRQAVAVIRSCAGLSALAAILGWMGLLLSPTGNTIVSPYQIVGALLSVGMLTVSFERNFPAYWHLAAALFFSASLVTWTGIGLAIGSWVPVVVLIIGIPIVAVLLPWDWQFQAALCLLCVGAGWLALRMWPDTSDFAQVWMIAAAESVVAILASIQLERQRREQCEYIHALAADEEQFRALIENSPDGLTVVDPVGAIVFKSPSAQRLLGHDDTVGHSIYEFMHQEDAAAFRALLADCLRVSDRTFSFSMRCRHADGSWRVVEGAAKQLMNYGAKPLVVLNWRDETERVAQERRLHESEEMFRKIFQYSTDAISIASRNDGRYLDVNDEWLALLGYARDEVIGNDPFTLGIWADPYDLTIFISEFLLKREVRNRRTRFRAKDGSIVHGLLSAVIVEAGGNEVSLGMVKVQSIEKAVPG